MNRKEYKEKYGVDIDWYKYYKSNLTEGMYFGHREHCMPYIQYCKKWAPNKKICEIGIGTGIIPIELCRAGFQVTCIDLEMNIIKQFQGRQKKYKTDCEVFCADAFDLGFLPNKSFDLISHQGLIEHFNNEDIYKMLDEHCIKSEVVLASVPIKGNKESPCPGERRLTVKEWTNILSARFRLIECVKWGAHDRSLEALFIIQGG